MSAYRHWRLIREAGGLARLCLDRQDAGANTLSRDVLLELDALLEELQHEAPKALLLQSDKASGFIAGADIQEFLALTSEQQALDLVKRAHAIFDRVAALPFPSIALIDGFCLGGGLELALACRYRIATDEPETRIGFPEILLGIHPGFGGTVRSIRCAGALQAMDLMLTGRTLNARRARAVGLVDRAVPRRQLQAAAHSFAEQPRSPRSLPLHLRALNHQPARALLARAMRARVAKRIRREHYPAPGALIDLYARYGHDYGAMMDAEARSIARLFLSQTSRNLVRVFFLQEALKAEGQRGNFSATRVHVVGAGTMGGDIAAWCALRGLTVTLQDRAPQYVADAVGRAERRFQRRLRDGRLRQVARDRLIPDVSGNGIARADVVIEAIIEDIEAKQALYRLVEPHMKGGAILATNTSSIPLAELSRTLQRPSRLVGLHFFNPVPQMKLVEIVADDVTDVEARTNAAAFARSIDKLPLPVTSTPGFLVNRILTPYMLEAVVLQQENVSPRTIDEAAKQFGMPMGPVELADTVGLDICLSVGNNLAEHCPLEIPNSLRQRVQRGELGKKSGHGYYRYSKGKRRGGGRRQAPTKEMRDRLLLRLLNECVAALREGVVANADLLDAGMVFGTGFAPFRGGPVNYIRRQGCAHLRQRLQELANEHGQRFAPDPGWEEPSFFELTIYDGETSASS